MNKYTFSGQIMIYLFIVSLIWAFSFGLIKTNLSTIHPVIVSSIRLFIALLVFLPFLRLSKVPSKLKLRLLLLGSVQYGLMYIFYNISFQYLKAYEVALFTIFTPIYVTLVNDLDARKFIPFRWITSILAIIGTAIIVQLGFHRPGLLAGFLILQISNLSFASGQVYYRKWMKVSPGLKDHQVFAILYFGGALLTILLSVLMVPLNQISISTVQFWTLLYLGAIASGLSFFLWNFGARRTNIGTLAIFNDLKIPLSITVSLLVFGEQTSLGNLIFGGVIILASLLINEYFEKRHGKHKIIPQKSSLTE